MWRSRWNDSLRIAFLLALVAATTAGASASTPRASRTKKGPSPLPQSATGPTSSAEAEILLRDGRAEYKAGRFEEATHLLKRYVDRYPSSPSFHEAQLMLGRSLLVQGKLRESIAPLQAYISAHEGSLQAQEVRLDIGHAQLGLKLFNEAYLSSIELLSAKQSDALPPKIEVSALLLRAQALLGLGRDDRALQAIENAQKKMGPINPDTPLAQAAPSASTAPTASGVPTPSVPAPQPDPFGALRMETEWTALRLKSRTCARLPSSGSLTEAQVLDQLSRRGDCLLEGITLTHEALHLPIAAGEETAVGGIQRETAESWAAYAKACRNPPPLPGKASATEKKHYRTELADQLLKGFDRKRAQAIEILKPTAEKETLPSTREAQLNELIRSLK